MQTSRFRNYYAVLLSPTLTLEIHPNILMKKLQATSDFEHDSSVCECCTETSHQIKVPGPCILFDGYDFKLFLSDEELQELYMVLKGEVCK